MGKLFFSSQKGILKRREMDGRDETLKDTEDTTLVQMEEVDRAIRAEQQSIIQLYRLFNSISQLKVTYPSLERLENDSSKS